MRWSRRRRWWLRLRLWNDEIALTDGALDLVAAPLIVTSDVLTAIGAGKSKLAHGCVV